MSHDHEHDARVQRRGFLKGAMAAVAGAGLLAAHRAEACADATPQQTEGPFYPVRAQADTNWDMTAVDGRNGTPLGQQMYLTGAVTDDQCRPVAGALVEIWQACASGRYSHPGDTSGLPLDPNFQYWGRVLTDASGNYLFKTVKPGHYPADANWERPPHIHLRASKRGLRELTTQVYFKGDQYNATDAILQALSADEQAQVVCELLPADPVSNLPLPFIRFDIGLRRPGAR